MIVATIVTNLQFPSYLHFYCQTHTPRMTSTLSLFTLFNNNDIPCTNKYLMHYTNILYIDKLLILAFHSE